MKKLILSAAVTAYVLAASILAAHEVNDRLAAHYAGQYTAEIAAALPVHLQEPME